MGCWEEELVEGKGAKSSIANRLMSETCNRLRIRTGSGSLLSRLAVVDEDG